MMRLNSLPRPYAVSFAIYESIRGGDLDTDFLPPLDLELLELRLYSSFLKMISTSTQLYWSAGAAYDLRLSPSFLKVSMILNISFLPPLASTIFPPMLMLIFSLAFALRSLFNNRCLIWMQT